MNGTEQSSPQSPHGRSGSHRIAFIGLAVALGFPLISSNLLIGDDSSGSVQQGQAVNSQPYLAVNGGLQGLQEGLGGADQKKLWYVVSRMALEGLSSPERETKTTEQPAEEQCTFSLSSESVHFGSTSGAERVMIATDQACAWDAASNIPWLDVKKQNQSAGSGVVRLSVRPNFSPLSRTAAVTVAGRILSITQSGAGVTAQHP